MEPAMLNHAKKLVSIRGQLPALAMTIIALAAADRLVSPEVASSAQNCVTTEQIEPITDPSTGQATGSKTTQNTVCSDVPDSVSTTPNSSPTDINSTPHIHRRNNTDRHPRSTSPRLLPHSFVNYNQNHTGPSGNKWGNRIASSGCGPTVIAMVMATLTGNQKITPKTVANQITPKYYALGSGTQEGAFKAVAKHYGVNETHAKSLDDAIKIAKLGGLSIVHAKPGHFTKRGHYMVLESYSNGKFQIADPNNKPGRDSETHGWSPKMLRAAAIDDIWTFQAAHR